MPYMAEAADALYFQRDGMSTLHEVGVIDVPFLRSVSAFALPRETHEVADTMLEAEAFCRYVCGEM